MLLEYGSCEIGAADSCLLSWSQRANVCDQTLDLICLQRLFIPRHFILPFGDDLGEVGVGQILRFARAEVMRTKFLSGFRTAAIWRMAGDTFSPVGLFGFALR